MSSGAVGWVGASLHRGALAAVAISMLGAALLTGCGGGPSGSPAATRRSSPATTSVAPTASAVASNPPGSPSLQPVVTGAPAFTYTVPAGWRLVQQDANQVDLATGISGSSAERIRLTLDIAQEQTAGDPTTTVGGHTAYVVRDGPSADGTTFTRVLLIADGTSLYELLCSGYLGYDRGRLTAGCDAFTASVRFAH